MTQRAGAVALLVEPALEIADLHLLRRDRAEGREARQRFLRASHGHAQRDQRAAAAGAGRPVVDGLDGAAERAHGVEHRLRRSGELGDATDREPQRGRVVLGALPVGQGRRRPGGRAARARLHPTSPTSTATARPCAVLSRTASSSWPARRCGAADGRECASASRATPAITAATAASPRTGARRRRGRRRPKASAGGAQARLRRQRRRGQRAHAARAIRPVERSRRR